ncbi:hypothetical protein G7Y89_g5209 [Cudoniella acicularis]|uniref:Biogenesis of lysosome-related organelles complex 1 subunit 1 n=1 Tax=Cudoniella acicularis TaxID=354080 RepID=A0A8H4RQ58_9HELO|nr:hypothetical protein G7Y89_g5209 [Cudoniella acicularis]
MSATATASTSAASGPSTSHSRSQSQAHSRSQSHISALPSPPSPESARQIAEARVALEASMSNIGSSLDTSLRTRATTLHANSAQLEKQQKDVIKETANLRKETEKLRKVADEGARKVKELGNVQNWAEMLERDFLVLEETLRLANESSGDSEWETEGSGSEFGDEDEGGKGKEGMDIGGIEDGRKAVDGEGDVAMDGVEHNDKGKSKEVEMLAVQDQATDTQHDVVGGSATTTIASASDPSSSSIHTTNSTNS